jgi:hypothetical protein
MIFVSNDPFKPAQKNDPFERVRIKWMTELEIAEQAMCSRGHSCVPRSLRSFRWVCLIDVPTFAL